MAKLHLPLLFFSLTVFSTCCHAVSTVTIAVDDPHVPPIYCSPSVTRQCILPGILKAAFAHSENQLQLTPMSSTREYMELAAGNIDGAIIFTSPSLPDSVFPDTVKICPSPIFGLSVGMYTLADKASELPMDSMEEMLKYPMAGARLPEFQRDILGMDAPLIMRTKNVTQMIRVLLASRVDFALYENYSTHYRLHKMGLEDQILHTRNVFDLYYYLALSTEALKTRPELIKLCDKLEELRQKGEVGRILQQSLDSFNIVPNAFDAPQTNHITPGAIKLHRHP
ncbi:hypothetical protein KOI40_07455 [Aestuariicella sp. G3-2]|uniref:hypothetical protein n=1 Tax=Pseudomaricurvus albidus TaxID=2842452 RepID=UPI001C0B37D5|nr:hypothetical protein [Aestuariicella albida]MBU3069652.1 hypothetical protein [Aestuariicella albida]